MIQMPARMYADLIGKPFAHGGRGPSAYDCVGLADEVLRRMGVCLPAHLSDEAELHRQLAAGGALEEGRRIAGPEMGAVVLLRSPHPTGRHIGIMVDPFLMLHCSEDAGSVVRQPLAQCFWGRRVVGFYRVLGEPQA